MTGFQPPGSEPLLTLVAGSTALYAPGGTGTSAFLLWNEAEAPTTLPLSSTWSDSGAPANPGWFVFLEAPVEAAIEGGLRAALAGKTSTGLAWAVKGAWIACAVPIACTADAGPSVASDCTLPTPAGLLALSFPAGTPLRSTGTLEGIVASAPTEAGPVRAGSDGTIVWIQGERAGCVTFQALAGQPPSAGGTVTLMEVSLDPLRPFDPSRSFQTFTGMSYGFTRDAGDRWQLVALEGGTG